jgi:hypothetical protein
VCTFGSCIVVVFLSFAECAVNTHSEHLSYSSSSFLFIVFTFIQAAFGRR